MKSENGDNWNFSSLGGNNTVRSRSLPQGCSGAAPQTLSRRSSGNPNLSVKKFNVENGRLTVSRADADEKPRVYDKVNIEVTDFSFTTAFPFKMKARSCPAVAA